MKKGIILGTILSFFLLQGTSYAVSYDLYKSSENDTFGTIAENTGVDVDELLKLNPLVDPNNLWEGLLISLPKDHKPIDGLIPASEASRNIYTVLENDTMWMIANKFGLSLSYLLSANLNVKNPHAIFPGLELTIPTAPVSILPSTDWETKANYLIALGKDQFDVPYVWGGTTPFVGLDCSGFTQYLFAKIGIQLPRTAHLQFQNGIPVGKDQLRKGDLVFYKEHGSKTITHVGLYIGNDLMINADTDPKDGVQIEQIFGDAYYNSCYVGAKRFF